MTRLRMVLLGAFHVELDGTPLTRFGSAKTQALLAFLAMTAGQTHSRAVLATMFWPDENEFRASHNLRQAIYHLRHLLDQADSAPTPAPAFLQVTRQTILFNVNHEYDLDVNRFLEALRDGRLEDAAACYRGDLLAGLSVESAPFEQWQRLVREQLHRQALDALGQLTERHLQQRELDHARHLARRQLEMEPWNEPAHQQLMKALWLAGERGAALSQFEACRRILATELGIQPQADTLRLARQIRDDLPELKPTAAAAAVAPTWHNLPTPLTLLVDRAAELHQITGLLAQSGCRLLTITGLGGIGKTRLALEVARGQLHAGWDEVNFVALSPLTMVNSADSLALAIARALENDRPGLHLHGEPASAALTHLWRNRRVLVVLDNCEVINAGADWLADLLRAGPGLKLLAASRHRLNLKGEWVFPLTPLSTAPRTDGELKLSPAAELFVQRARQARPDFQVTQRNLPWIDQICQQLDGLPLGLELAAARVQRHTTRQIAGQLDASVAALSVDELDRPSRHRSLTAAFDSSLALLTSQERQFFRRMAVFVRGFNLEAAQAVAEATPATIFRLVDRSLLRFEFSSQRFYRHPLVATYALTKLRDEPGEEAAMRERHAAFFAGFLRDRRETLRGYGQVAALREIEADSENIMAAWWWAVDHRRLDLLAQAIEPLHDYHRTRGLHAEGVELFGKAAITLRTDSSSSGAKAVACALLAKRIFYLHARGKLEEAVAAGREIEQLNADRPDVNRTVSLRWWGSALNRLGRTGEAQACLEQSLALSRQLGDSGAQFEALRGLVHFWMRQGELATARSLLDQAWTLQADATVRDEWITLRLGGYLAAAQGDFERAESEYRQALACAERIEDDFAQALIKERLGEAYLMQGKLAQARDMLENSLAAFRNAGAGEYEGLALYHLGRTLALAGQPEAARQVFREGLAVAQKLGYTRQAEEIRKALDLLQENAGNGAQR